MRASSGTVRRHLCSSQIAGTIVSGAKLDREGVVGSVKSAIDRNDLGDRIIEHMAMITSWEEFERFFATVRPIDVRVYGKLSAQVQDWIEQFDVLSKTFEEHVAGFVR